MKTVPNRAMAQHDASLVPETPEAQQETGVAEASNNARTTGPGAPPAA
jgi:hypothetical protein